MKESTKSSTAWVWPVVILASLTVGYIVGSETAPDCPECPDPPPPCLTDGVCKTELDIIDWKEAHTYHSAAYESYAEDETFKFRCFQVNLEQWCAMAYFLGKDKPYTSFRVYTALNEEDPYSLVVPVIEDLDDVEEVCKVGSGNSGLCPTLCDEDSPILKGASAPASRIP